MFVALWMTIATPLLVIESILDSHLSQRLVRVLPKAVWGGSAVVAAIAVWALYRRLPAREPVQFLPSSERGRLRDLGPVLLLLPPAIWLAIWLLVTKLFGLPAENWAVICAGFCVLSLGLLWLGVRRVPREKVRVRDRPSA